MTSELLSSLLVSFSSSLSPHSYHYILVYYLSSTNQMVLQLTFLSDFMTSELLSFSLFLFLPSTNKYL